MQAAASAHRARALPGPSRGSAIGRTYRATRPGGVDVAALGTSKKQRTILAFSSSSSSSSSSSPALDKPRGESGLDIGGSRPTSPKAWKEIKSTLKANDAKHISPQELVFARDRGGGRGNSPLQQLPSLLSALPIFSSSSTSSSSSSNNNNSNSNTGALILEAVNVPLYRPITGLSPRAVARRAVFAFFGVLNGTECNPAFAEEAAQALADAGSPKRVVAYCNVGGSFSSETNERGTQSRSMSAAYELIRAGICGNSAKVKIDMLKGGFNEWLKSEREVAVPE